VHETDLSTVHVTHLALQVHLSGRGGCGWRLRLCRCGGSWRLRWCRSDRLGGLFRPANPGSFRNPIRGRNNRVSARKNPLSRSGHPIHDDRRQGRQHAPYLPAAAGQHCDRRGRGPDYTLSSPIGLPSGVDRVDAEPTPTQIRLPRLRRLRRRLGWWFRRLRLRENVYKFANNKNKIENSNLKSQNDCSSAKISFRNFC